MPDKIVMAHSKEYRSNKTFVTIEAHTGRSLWHSHAVMTTAITNLWQGGARYLGAPGKHDQVAGDANHVVMVRANRGGITTGGGGTSTADNENQQSSLPPPNFPQRNASDMFAPGQWVRTAFLSHFMLKRPFCQVRLGTNIGEKQKVVFRRRHSCSRRMSIYRS